MGTIFAPGSRKIPELGFSRTYCSLFGRDSTNLTGFAACRKKRYGPGLGFVLWSRVDVGVDGQYVGDHHQIIDDGYNIGRDYLVSRAVRKGARVEWREDLLEAGNEGTEHLVDHSLPFSDSYCSRPDSYCLFLLDANRDQPWNCARWPSCGAHRGRCTITTTYLDEHRIRMDHRRTMEYYMRTRCDLYRTY